MAHGRGQEILGEGRQGGGAPGFAGIPTAWWALKVVARFFSGTSFQGMHGGEGKAAVIFALFTGNKKNSTPKPRKNSASEEDHLPLQVLQST